MATINYTFTAQVGYTGNYVVKAYKLSTGAEMASVTRSPAYAIPVTGTLTVPTTEPHIVKVFAVGCDNALVGETIFYNQAGSCGAPSAPVITDITDTTADADWGPPIAGGVSGYTWFLYKIVGSELIYVTTGTVTPATVELAGLVKNTKYRLIVYGNCNGEGDPVDAHSVSVFEDFETTGPDIIGSVALDGGDGYTVTLRSTTNLNEYGIDGEVGSLDLPCDEYEIIRFTAPCEGATISPDLYTTFTLGAVFEPLITISCP